LLRILKIKLEQVVLARIMRIFLTAIFALLFLPGNLLAQQPNPDFFRSIGKIYAVVAVIVLILVGIFLFLFYLERKIKKLENQLID